MKNCPSDKTKGICYTNAKDFAKNPTVQIRMDVYNIWMDFHQINIVAIFFATSVMKIVKLDKL